MKIRDDIPEDVREALRKLFTYKEVGGMSDLARVVRAPDPAEPPIPWQYIDKRWRWMVMDSDDGWWVYVSRPVCGDKGWDNSGRASPLPCPPGADRHWTQTLIERPEDE